MLNASLTEEPNLTTSEPCECENCECASFLSVLIQIQEILSCFKSPFLLSRNVIMSAGKKESKPSLLETSQIYVLMYV